MQKLVIQSQFMGVKPCEIEIRKFLLLIGEQASGKSTIAKLIYFFQTLPDAVYGDVVLGHLRNRQGYVLPRVIEKVAQERFIENFGTVHQSQPFKITFFYNADKISTKLDIFKNNEGEVKTKFSSLELRFENATKLIEKNIDEKYQTKPDKESEIVFREEQRKMIDSVFERECNFHTYFIAGRNSVVSNSELYENFAAKETEKLIEAEVKKDDLEKRLRLGNERLLLEFIEWSKNTKEYFKKSGHSFFNTARLLENKLTLNELIKISDTILKGSYSSENDGEKIFIANESYAVPLQEASSGQQEALRILQGIFLAIGLKNRKEFLIIEEPEAHLFPLAQRELINAFALFLNTIPEGRLIITTHSPYILACVNLLLMAGYTSRQNGEVLRQKVGEAVPQSFWLNSDDFNAYALGGEEYRHDIKDGVTGLISENYLDNISEHLGMQFHQLYDLLTQPA